MGLQLCRVSGPLPQGCGAASVRAAAAALVPVLPAVTGEARPAELATDTRLCGLVLAATDAARTCSFTLVAGHPCNHDSRSLWADTASHIAKAAVLTPQTC